MKLGQMQKLVVVRNTSVGVYLNERGNIVEDDILLPKKEVPENTSIDKELEVFVYRDSEDRWIATLRTPKIILGQLARLKVVEITKIGAFLNWGLEKDLFLPFKEQTSKISKGKEYLVSLYIDKSERLCATMNVYNLLSSTSPYKENDMVRGTIYILKEEMGAFVAVDDLYHGLIPVNELYGSYACGDQIEARVFKVREDGRLSLSLRKKAHMQMDDDAYKILERLRRKAGYISLHDHSTPEEIKQELNMSKNAFKRAVGRLLKEKRIILTDRGIQYIEK